MTHRCDSKDLSILAILQKQGRIAISELAARLNMSDTPCLRRIRKMEQNGVIKGYSADLDPQALDLNVTVYAFVRLKENSAQYANQFEQAVTDLAQVLECSVISGAHDYLIKIIAKDLADYECFIKQRLGELKCIASIESSVVLKQTFSSKPLPIRT
ncbi:Lrp/AsnC family transcriptional regulator [Shewanella waksmanii]|uniref:Lrp/AsnC family transcriptional regulator n=1 Tax=Shewanella waksmanii TaxID=213783 RepID=UPI0004903E98|nr:Lrp/AsnC family transcriptional regulator [Shewanella waksmanii]